MPTVLLPVPHFEQSRDGACLPACTRMVLAFWDDERTEIALVTQLKSKPFGTPIFNASRLQEWRYQVEIRELDRADLEGSLRQGQPVIARIWTTMLDYWETDTSHVVVVVGFDEGIVYLNDPAFSSGPQTAVWDEFLAAWAEFDETAVLIKPA